MGRLHAAVDEEPQVVHKGGVEHAHGHHGHGAHDEPLGDAQDPLRAVLASEPVLFADLLDHHARDNPPEAHDHPHVGQDLRHEVALLLRGITVDLAVQVAQVYDEADEEVERRDQQRARSHAAQPERQGNDAQIPGVVVEEGEHGPGRPSVVEGPDRQQLGLQPGGELDQQPTQDLVEASEEGRADQVLHAHLPGVEQDVPGHALQEAALDDAVGQLLQVLDPEQGHQLRVQEEEPEVEVHLRQHPLGLAAESPSQRDPLNRVRQQGPVHQQQQQRGEVLVEGLAVGQRAQDPGRADRQDDHYHDHHERERQEPEEELAQPPRHVHVIPDDVVRMRRRLVLQGHRGEGDVPELEVLVPAHPVAELPPLRRPAK
mmetsp:Transcript_25856/g.81671  ORF Transcript_25856/g.81671 Transcript_25856/m.81671 type:complete len:373 (+) Transcript_25856:318-1436(+)